MRTAALLFLLLTFGCQPAQQSLSASRDYSALSPDTVPSRDTSGNFHGEVRAAAKTSFVAAPADTFRSLQAYYRWLPSDLYMHTKTEARRENSPRTQEENHNVVLTDVYIFGVKREDDNDYHVILGATASPDKAQQFFSAEISGLPDPSSPYYATLSAVREKFKAHFGKDIKKEIVFTVNEKHPPMHVKSISGSLFFDNHHYSGHSSVQGYKACSAWEIHPVTAIEFY